jgi:hypothetical protein
MTGGMTRIGKDTVAAYFNHIINVAPRNEGGQTAAKWLKREDPDFQSATPHDSERKSSRVSSVTPDMPGKYLALVKANYFHVLYKFRKAEGEGRVEGRERCLCLRGTR